MQRMFLSKLRRAAALGVSAMLSVSLLSTSVFAEGSLPAEDRNGDGIINVFDYVLEKRDTVDACSPFTLDISDATGIAGETVWLDVSIENNPGLTNVSFMLGYNPELKPFLNGEQLLDYFEGEVAESYGTAISLYAPDSKITCISPISEEPLTINGNVARIGFTIPRNAKTGDIYTVIFKKVSCRTEGGQLLKSYLIGRGDITVAAGARWTSTPRMAKSWGIDVSQWQDDVDFEAVRRNGVEFVMLRAGYGSFTKQVDTKFYEYYDAAKAAGLPVGAYWFSYALTPEAAVKEAEVCMEILGDRSFEFPIAFDIEYKKQLQLSAADFSAVVDAFCTTMERNGYYVVVYSSASPLNTLLKQSVREKHDVWVANYNVAKPIYTGRYGMWQFSSTGAIDGIKGDVDLDYAYEDYASLMNATHLNKCGVVEEEPQEDASEAKTTEEILPEPATEDTE